MQLTPLVIMELSEKSWEILNSFLGHWIFPGLYYVTYVEKFVPILNIKKINELLYSEMLEVLIYLKKFCTPGKLWW